MIANYFLIAARILRTNLFFSLIMVIGLSVSYTSFHWLWFYAEHELHADQFHRDFKKIYRVYYTWRYSDDGSTFHEENWGPNLFVTGPWLKNKYEEVESFTRIVNQSAFRESLVGHDTEIYFEYEAENQKKISFKEENIAYGDANLFSFFTMDLLQGEAQSALNNSNSVVISKSVAKKYFGGNDPLGKILLLNGTKALNVSGVFDDLPSNTHLNFDIVVSAAGFSETFTAHDFSGVAHTYVKLTDQTNARHFQDKILTHDDDFWKPIYLRYTKETATTKLQPLESMVFDEPMARDDFQQKSKSILYILKTIAVCILIMGWVNYINLTFSRVMKRIKELATRRTFGAGQRDFFLQFLIETLLINVSAIGLAMLATSVSSDLIAHLISVNLPTLNNRWSTILFYMLIVLSGCSLIALYPTLIAKSLSINVLFRTNSKSPGIGKLFLKIISVTQYSIAIMLILWVVVINLQMDHLLNLQTGLKKEQVIIIDGPLNKSKNYTTEVASLGNELRKLDNVSAFTSSHSVVGDKNYKMVLLKAHGKSNNAGLLTNGGIDETFISFYGIKLLSGRNFFKDMPSETNAILLSKIGAERLGWMSPDEAVGQKILLDNWGNPLNNGNELEVIGVFQDYDLYPYIKTGSLSNDALGSQGLFFTYKNMAIPGLTPNKISIKITGDYDAALDAVEKTYTTLFSQSFFNWYFLDAHFNKAYRSHLDFRDQMTSFAFLAIFIACLGLLGTSSFMASEKIKELAVRKVLGAGPGNLIRILISGTAGHLLLSLFIGLPLGYFFILEYLATYTARVTVQWWIFLMPLTLLTVVFFCTILPVLYRAIKINPVTSLKNN
jgi:putative ABC transport system permease protein